MLTKVNFIPKSKRNIVTKFQASIFQNSEVRGGGGVKGLISWLRITRNKVKILPLHLN